MKSVKIDDLSKEIMEGLNEYKDLTSESVKDAVKKASIITRDVIKEKAPVKSGKYKKSWKVSKVEETSNKLIQTVHSKDQYQLTHLLENGHALKGGGRSKYFPHIGEGEKEGEKVLLELIERKLK